MTSTLLSTICTNSTRHTSQASTQMPDRAPGSLRRITIARVHEYNSLLQSIAYSTRLCLLNTLTTSDLCAGR